jgi:hypothetical protein
VFFKKVGGQAFETSLAYKLADTSWTVNQTMAISVTFARKKEPYIFNAVFPALMINRPRVDPE